MGKTDTGVQVRKHKNCSNLFMLAGAALLESRTQISLCLHWKPRGIWVRDQDTWWTLHHSTCCSEEGHARRLEFVWPLVNDFSLDFESQVLESRATEGSYSSTECKASLATHRETNTEYFFKLGPFTGKFVGLDLWHVSASMFSCWTSIQSLHLLK